MGRVGDRLKCHKGTETAVVREKQKESLVSFERKGGTKFTTPHAIE